MQDLVEERLAALRTRPVAQLQLLSDCSEEDVVLNGKSIKLTTYHAISNEGSQRVVIQAIRQRWGGLTAKVVVSGFETANDGTVRALTDEELYDYT